MIIGISAKSGAGKDQVATILKERGFTRLAFADAVKRLCKNYIGMTDSELSDENKDLPIPRFNGVTGREIIIKMGEAVRGVYPNAWVDRVLPYLDLEYDYVITDVRFEEELKALRDMGAVILRVERPGHVSTHSCAGHVSEQMSDKEIYDYKIVNDGTLEDLKDKVLRLVQKLK
jgi:hypothetical protein